MSDIVSKSIVLNEIRDVVEQHLTLSDGQIKDDMIVWLHPGAPDIYELHLNVFNDGVDPGWNTVEIALVRSDGLGEICSIRQGLFSQNSALNQIDFMITIVSETNDFILELQQMEQFENAINN